MANVLRHFRRTTKKEPKKRNQNWAANLPNATARRFRSVFFFFVSRFLHFYSQMWQYGKRHVENAAFKWVGQEGLGRIYSLRFPLGMYTLPDGVRTKHDGSKSTPKSFGLLATAPAIKRALFMRLIVGLRGGTSGGAVGVTPSRRKPAKGRECENSK